MSEDTKLAQVTRRRDFLSRSLGAWAVMVMAPIAKGVLDFVSPIKSRNASQEEIRVASTTDLKLNSAKIFKIDKQPVIVVHTKSGQYKAFNARCTHLGCVVQFNTEEGEPHFSCNCHGSEFDINGKNIDGPALRPLTAFKVILRESSVLIAKN